MDSAGPSNKAPEAAKPSEGKKGMEQLSLPFTQVKRIVASHLAADTKISINKEATLAFSEAAKVFISYISTTATEICKEKKRQTISSTDVLQSLEELDFQELVPQLKEFLALYQKSEGEKKMKRSLASKASKEKKRKTMDEVAAPDDQEDPNKSAAEE